MVLAAITIAIAGGACATAPKQTAASRRVAANPRAIVEGRVRNADGKPVAGIGVRGIPGGKDVPWGSVAVTGCDGSFRLTLPAPASYTFLLLWHGTAVITPDPQDPSRTSVSVAPGAVVRGVDLVFLAPQWREAAASAPTATPSCP
jgi:hypothetical protein